MTGIKNYNTISKGCAEKCQRIRRGMGAGISPGNVISEACQAAGITYGGCSSKTGPIGLPDGSQQCLLPPEAGRAVDTYTQGVLTAAARMGATLALQESKTVATGAV